MLVEGKSTKKIADELVIAINTVKSHKKSIYGKAGVNTHEELVQKLIDQELVAE